MMIAMELWGIRGGTPNEMCFAVHFPEWKMSDKVRISPI